MIDKYFTARRSIRRFTAEPVGDELLRDILAAAMKAPTCGNMQLYSVIVTRDKDAIAALAPAHFSQPAATGATVLLTFCADFNRFVKWCEASGAEPGYDNFQSWMAAVLDTAAFAQQFCTVAEMQGLGTVYLGTTTYNAPDIARNLGLPARVVPVTTVALGWPDEEGEETDRLPLEAVMHIEKYADVPAAQVKQWYAAKEARDDSRRFVEENGKQSLAQVFTDIRYSKPNNEHFSRVYLDFLNSAGYPTQIG